MWTISAHLQIGFLIYVIAKGIRKYKASLMEEQMYIPILMQMWMYVQFEYPLSSWTLEHWGWDPNCT